MTNRFLSEIDEVEAQPLAGEISDPVARSNRAYLAKTFELLLQLAGPKTAVNQSRAVCTPNLLDVYDKHEYFRNYDGSRQPSKKNAAERDVLESEIVFGSEIHNRLLLQEKLEPLISQLTKHGINARITDSHENPKFVMDTAGGDFITKMNATLADLIAENKDELKRSLSVQTLNGDHGISLEAIIAHAKPADAVEIAGAVMGGILATLPPGKDLAAIGHAKSTRSAFAQRR